MGDPTESLGPEAPSEARQTTKPGGRSPARVTPAVAANRMERLTLWTAVRVESFPRGHKFTIGDRWLETCLDIQTSLVEAAYTRDKRQLLQRASRGLVRARVLARMAAALRAVSLEQEAHFGRESGEVGRMIGGWLRALGGRVGKQDVGGSGARDAV